VSEANFTPQYRAALQRSYHSTTPAGQKRYDQWYGRPLVNCFNDTSRQEVDATNGSTSLPASSLRRVPREIGQSSESRLQLGNHLPSLSGSIYAYHRRPGEQM
jgi:peptidoglycan hydrolase-like protein with peptidoglycan-binding domain